MYVTKVVLSACITLCDDTDDIIAILTGSLFPAVKTSQLDLSINYI